MEKRRRRHRPFSVSPLLRVSLSSPNPREDPAMDNSAAALAMADVPRLAGLVGGRAAARAGPAAGPRFDLHLVGVQQIGDGFFPGRDVLVIDGVLARFIV